MPIVFGERFGVCCLIFVSLLLFRVGFITFTFWVRYFSSLPVASAPGEGAEYTKATGWGGTTAIVPLQVRDTFFPPAGVFFGLGLIFLSEYLLYSSCSVSLSIHFLSFVCFFFFVMGGHDSNCTLSLIHI